MKSVRMFSIWRMAWSSSPVTTGSSEYVATASARMLGSPLTIFINASGGTTAGAVVTRAERMYFEVSTDPIVCWMVTLRRSTPTVTAMEPSTA